MFTARLKNLLNYFVKSRQVDDNFAKIFDLIMADKLKEILALGPLQFVLSKERAECLPSTMIADIHANSLKELECPILVNKVLPILRLTEGIHWEMDSDFALNANKYRLIRKRAQRVI